MEVIEELKTRVYRFGNKTADGNSKMRNLLGGKGANLAEMSAIGIPVPPGFTITTEVCTEYCSYECVFTWNRLIRYPHIRNSE